MRRTAGYDLDTSTSSFASAQREYRERSREAGRLEGALLDLAYGTHPRQMLDVFPAGPKAPVLVFFHGGYWKAGTKDERRFPALEWMPRAVTWIAVNYRLVPEATLADIVDDARSATLWLAQNAARLGIDRTQMHLIGNSAGGHLAGMAAADWGNRPPIRSVLAVSGLFDLVPLLDATPNDWLGLDPVQATSLSPVHHLPPPELPVSLCVGGNETSAFFWQLRRYADACRLNGNEVIVSESPGKDHFEIIGELASPGSAVFERMKDMIDR